MKDKLDPIGFFALSLIGGMLVLAMLFWLALTAVYAIPKSSVENGIRESQEILAAEGGYPPSYATGVPYDNFTVGIMIAEAAYAEGNPFIASLESKYFLDKDNMAQGVSESLDGNWNTNYSRYWHGYLLFLRPLLIWFNVQQIRLLCLTVFAILLGASSVLLYRRLGKVGALAAISLTLSEALIGGFDAALTLPIFPSFAIALAGVIWITTTKELKPSRMRAGFFLIGAITVYFDFLDNPILTLGLPLAVYVLCEYATETVTAKTVSHVISYCLMWCIGYACLWGLKWLLALAINGPETVSALMGKASMWVGVDPKQLGVTASPLIAIRANISALGWTKYPLFLIGAVCVISIAARIVRRNKLEGNRNNYVIVAIILIVIALFPYLWYAALCGHSTTHAAFIAFRDQLITLFVLGIIPTCSMMPPSNDRMQTAQKK